jgi:transcriptional regulator with XRE-family HTH domain
MKAKDLKLELKSEEMSQRRMARFLGIDERTMRRYCSGELPIPKTIEYAVLYVINCMDEEDFLLRLNETAKK